MTDDMIHKIDDLNEVTLVYNMSFFEDYKPVGTSEFVLVSVYGALFTLGLLGNIWVILSVVYRLCQPRCEKRHILLYVLCLSVVDSLCLSFLPVIIVDMLSPYWIFDVLTCKLLWSFESPSKILSTFLLVALSANCYLAVCKPLVYKRWKRRRYSILVTVSSAALSMTCMTPIYIYSNVYVAAIPISEFGDEMLVMVQKCMFYSPDPAMRMAFITYIFVIGFVVTTILQITFYGLLITHVTKHKRRFARSRVPLGHITKTVMSLGAFHLFCWGPYWASTLQLVYQEEAPIKIVAYIVHLLPYLNAAVNPTLYLRLNTNKEDTLSGYITRSIKQKKSSANSFMSDSRQVVLKSFNLNSNGSLLTPQRSVASPEVHSYLLKPFGIAKSGSNFITEANNNGVSISNCASSNSYTV